MMHSKRCLFLPLLIFLLAVPAWANNVTIIADQRVIETTAKEMPAGMKAHWRVLGIGQDEDAAAKDAISKARDVVFAWMKEQEPNFVWKPTSDFVENYLRTGEARREKEFEKALDEKVFKGQSPPQWYSVPVGISDKGYRELLRGNQRYLEKLTIAEQHQRSQDRLMILAKVVAFVLSACFLTLVYIRLDEKTRGFFSRWIGIGVLTLLGVVGIVLYFFL